MITFPNAKINLGLHVLNKRDDGYHNIETIMCPVRWCDILEFNKVESNNTSIDVSGIDLNIPMSDNICIKAYNLMKLKYKLPNIKILLHKIIPYGAGLGGGSSNAAFLITALNNYFDLKLSSDEMQKIAAEIGSDCAFFIQNIPALAKERGNILQTCSISLKGLYIIIVYPNIQISTAQAYSMVKPNKPQLPLSEIINMPIYEWKNYLVNDFQIPIQKKYPEIKRILNELYAKGAVYASLSGSGSAVYGIFNKPIEYSCDKYLIFNSIL